MLRNMLATDVIGAGFPLTEYREHCASVQYGLVSQRRNAAILTTMEQVPILGELIIEEPEELP